MVGVNSFIETNYDTEALKRVFISGDGAGWIKSGVTYVDNSVISLLMAVVQKATSVMYCQTVLVPDRWDGARPEQTE